MTVAAAPAPNLQVELSNLHFEGIVNDGSPRSMSLLLSAKELYKAELTDMPQDYIAHLVFDSYHETLAVLDRTELLGGITFRCFRELGFVEIAFVAVRKDRAARGVGGLMMSHLKEWMRRRRIYHLLACADLAAVGFFRKLGFNDEIVLPTSSYQGHIKEYQRVLLMECVITDAVPLLHTRQTLKVQLEAVVSLLAASCSDFKTVTPPARRAPGFLRPPAPPSLRSATVVDTDSVARFTEEYTTVLEEASAVAPEGAALLESHFVVIRKRLAAAPDKAYYVTPYMFAADCRRAFRAARAGMPPGSIVSATPTGDAAGGGGGKEKSGKESGGARGEDATEEREAVDAFETAFLRALGRVYRSWRRSVDAAADDVGATAAGGGGGAAVEGGGGGDVVMSTGR